MRFELMPDKCRPILVLVFPAPLQFRKKAWDAGSLLAHRIGDEYHWMGYFLLALEAYHLMAGRVM